MNGFAQVVQDADGRAVPKIWTSEFYPEQLSAGSTGAVSPKVPEVLTLWSKAHSP